MRNLSASDESTLSAIQLFLVRTRTGHEWHLSGEVGKPGRTKCGAGFIEVWTWDAAGANDHLCNRCLEYLGIKPVTP